MVVDLGEKSVFINCNHIVTVQRSLVAPDSDSAHIELSNGNQSGIEVGDPPEIVMKKIIDAMAEAATINRKRGTA